MVLFVLRGLDGAWWAHRACGETTQPRDNTVATQAPCARQQFGDAAPQASRRTGHGVVSRRVASHRDGHDEAASGGSRARLTRLIGGRTPGRCREPSHPVNERGTPPTKRGRIKKRRGDARRLAHRCWAGAITGLASTASSVRGRQEG